MKILRRFISHYLPIMPQRYVYMLQTVEYQPRAFENWVYRWPDLTTVIRRGKLVKTRKARALLTVAYFFYALFLIFILYLAVSIPTSLILLLALPIWVQLALSLVARVGGGLLTISRRGLFRQAEAKLAQTPAVKIAVLGSYGKTTMKEILLTVLSESEKVKATPGNMNVPISHARWIMKKLDGSEAVLIFEYGEAVPGDIGRFATMTQPDYAVITGLAPAHMEGYGSLETVAADFASIRSHVPADKLYVNAESPELMTHMGDLLAYSINGTAGWKTSHIVATIEGITFTMKKGDKSLRLQTGLIGLHQIGPLTVAVDIADKLGLSPQQIEAGVAKTKPFEHRMNPYRLGGAWVIDDTYNGNIDGMKAGLKLLSELEASGRKVYVTPGLVEQGDLKETVHQELGRSIAQSSPDRVVLMKNSATPFIQAGLDEAGYAGELIIEGDPLEFYTNLEHFVAHGDVVLLQNDWTDNYA